MTNGSPSEGPEVGRALAMNLSVSKWPEVGGVNLVAVAILLTMMVLLFFPALVWLPWLAIAFVLNAITVAVTVGLLLVTPDQTSIIQYVMAKAKERYGPETLTYATGYTHR